MTTGGPKAIETVYNGYRFRSRLEARWAVFFDRLRVRYEYEKEGYQLARTPEMNASWSSQSGAIVHYLPDFWLPELGCFVEIKGAEPTAEDDEKAFRLAWHSQKPVFVFVGECWLPQLLNDAHPHGFIPYRERNWDHETDELDEWYGVVKIHPYWWLVCPWCLRAGISHRGIVRDLLCGCEAKHNPYSWPDQVGPVLSLPLTQAFTAARQARFEHGERG